MKELLPLGSVVSLHGGSKRLMIVGRLQNKMDDDVVYDYASTLFPEGLIDSEHFYLFNHEDIDCMFYVGLQDLEEFNYRYVLEEKWNELKKDD